MELDPGGDGPPGAELVGEDREAADAGVAVDVAEVPAALEEAGYGGLGGAGCGLVKFRFGGLREECAEEGGEGLGVNAGRICEGLVGTAFVD